MGKSHPDADIHDRATGPAADTVAKHQDPQDIVFWSGWVSRLQSHKLCRSAVLIDRYS